VPRQKKALSDAALEMIAERFQLLAEPMRLKILHALWDGELTVGEIVSATGALQASVSKHLGILQLGGLVRRRREGLKVYSAIADEASLRSVKSSAIACMIVWRCGSNNCPSRLGSAARNDDESLVALGQT
jgi:ArsR family transcriptional regulator